MELVLDELSKVQLVSLYEYSQNGHILPSWYMSSDHVSCDLFLLSSESDALKQLRQVGADLHQSWAVPW